MLIEIEEIVRYFNSLGFKVDLKLSPMEIIISVPDINWTILIPKSKRDYDFHFVAAEFTGYLLNRLKVKESL